MLIIVLLFAAFLLVAGALLMYNTEKRKLGRHAHHVGNATTGHADGSGDN